MLVTLRSNPEQYADDLRKRVLDALMQGYMESGVDADDEEARAAQADRIMALDELALAKVRCDAPYPYLSSPPEDGALRCERELGHRRFHEADQQGRTVAWSQGPS